MRRCTVCVVALSAMPPHVGQVAAVARDACALVSRVEVRRLALPHDVKGVPDSSGLGCRWGSVDDNQALVVKIYTAMTPATIERMRIAAARTSDPILEPTVTVGAWSVGKSFGRVLVAGRNGRAFQLQYFVRPHSRGADRVDVRSTEADRDALLAIARVALSRL